MGIEPKLEVKVVHVTKTTEEWANEATIIDTGVLCFEFTPDGKTLAKVGDGQNTYTDLPYIQDFENIYSDLNSKADNFKNVYVNADTGNDDNDGSSKSAAFLTIDRALEAVSDCVSWRIEMAAGVYTVSGGLLYISRKNAMIVGASSSTTTLKCTIRSRNSQLITNTIAIDSSGLSADQTIKNEGCDFHAWKTRVVGDGLYGVYSSGGSYTTLQIATIIGATKYAVYNEGASRVQLYAVADNTGFGIRNEVCSEASIATTTTSGDINYSCDSESIVYYNGIQVAPVDMSADNIIDTVQNSIMPYAEVYQDSSVDGQYMLIAELTADGLLNFEGYTGKFDIRNYYVTGTAHQEGTLRVRLRYAKSTAKFTIAQIYWDAGNTTVVDDWYLATNDSTKTARIYVKCSSTYSGYVCRLMDRSASGTTTDQSKWVLSNQISGDAELPTTDDGWVITTSVQSEFHESMHAELDRKANVYTVIYVDAANGSDDNDGLNASTALKTLDAAISLGEKCTAFGIRLLDGVYEISGGRRQINRSSFFIVGENATETPTIKGCIYPNQCRVNLSDVIIDATGSGYPAFYPNMSDVRARMCTFISDAEYCVHAKLVSHVGIDTCTFSGTPTTHAMRIDGESSANIWNTKDETGLGVNNTNACEMHISTTTGSGDILMDNRPHAVTYYNGQLVGGANTYETRQIVKIEDGEDNVPYNYFFVERDTDTIDINVAGRNLLNGGATGTFTHFGLTYTCNADGSITMNGTRTEAATGSTNIFLLNRKGVTLNVGYQADGLYADNSMNASPYLPAGKYTISRSVVSGSISVESEKAYQIPCVSILCEDGTRLRDYTENSCAMNDVGYTFNAPSPIVMVALRVPNTWLGTADNWTIKFQLESGIDRYPYEDPVDVKTYTIPTNVKTSVDVDDNMILQTPSATIWASDFEIVGVNCNKNTPHLTNVWKKMPIVDKEVSETSNNPVSSAAIVAYLDEVILNGSW